MYGEHIIELYIMYIIWKFNGIAIIFLCFREKDKIESRDKTEQCREKQRFILDLRV